MKLISVVTPCYNEEQNVQEVYDRVRKVFEFKSNYQYEHIFIDNASTDKTVEILRRIALSDKHIKIIVNARNFGPVRSPFYGLLQTSGDAATVLAADLQEPPELLYQFIEKWESGYKIVVAIKQDSKEARIMFLIRKLFYYIAKKVSDLDLLQNFAGFGLYDRKIIDILKKIEDPYPYFRGLICEIGFERAEIKFVQPARTRGKTGISLYLLFDVAMLGIMSHSKIPLRIATITGFCLSSISILISIIYFLGKLLFWNYIPIGIAPLIIGVFFFASVQLFFIGIIGEYVGTIYSQILKRSLVIEKERVNF